MDRLHENRIYTGTVESYSSEGLGIVRLDGAVVFVPQAVRGESIDLDKIYQFMARRAPKQNKTSTQRKEKDMPQIMSGYFNGKTTGTPLCALIANTDQHSQDYSNLSRLARPGHADYTGALRYRGFNDVRGGGHFSGRLTAPLCFAGAVAGQILEKEVSMWALISQKSMA